MNGRILVIRGGAIGDFILTLPAIAALRSRFPEAHLEILGYPHIAQIAVAARLVDRARSIEARALAGFFARHGELAEELSDYFSEFDLIVSYLYDPDHIFQSNVCGCTPAQFIAGPHRPDEIGNEHATRVFLRPLQRLAIFEADPVPRLQIKSQLGRDTRPMVAIHPGSGSERKNWPEERWAALIGRLEGFDCNLLLVGGEAEGARLERLAGKFDPARLSIARSLPLPELARLLQDCALFLGQDSGISHLAAALGLPVLVLWGESNEEVWRPLGPSVIVLRHPGGLAHLEVEEVLDHVARRWTEPGAPAPRGA